MKLLLNLLRFARPHTIIGTSLSLAALYLLALGYSEASGLRSADAFLWAWISCLGANVYIVGLNQITDIDIDRINKPYLPLASGAFSLPFGFFLIYASVAVSLVVAWLQGGYLLATVLLSLALGTAYSLPPIRLKRFHFWAAFCIIAVRSLIVNLLLFLHFHQIINQSERLPLEIWLLTGIIFAYSIVIAWFKDIPDMEGDDSFRIRTLSIQLGARRVFLIGNYILTAAIVLLIALCFTLSFQLSATVLAVGHLLILIALWIVNWREGLRREQAFQHLGSWFPRYYQFIWILFFGEYLTFALAA